MTRKATALVPDEAAAGGEPGHGLTPDRTAADPYRTA